MCSLFGLIDYGRALSARERQRTVTTLAQVCEARGKDATGIAYVSSGRLQIDKRPLAAHRIHFHLPHTVTAVLGHTRMATQGDAHINANNHPFRGWTCGGEFALAHNGVLTNDRELRVIEKLPATDIETDSYVAVQLIEQMGILDTDAIAQMAGLLEGSFTFTLLDEKGNHYFVRGNNPICLYHWPQAGVYIYASTGELLKAALAKLSLRLGRAEHIPLSPGEILRIDRNGMQHRAAFSTARLFSYRPFPAWTPLPYYPHEIERLRHRASMAGWVGDDIDELLADSITLDEIESFFSENLYERTT